MALTPLRWSVALLIAMVVALVIPRQGSEVRSIRVTEQLSSEAAAHRRATQRLGRVQTKLSMAQRRDSARALVRANEISALRVHFDPTLPAALVDYLSALIEDEWSAAERVAAVAGPVAYVAVRDTSQRSAPLHQAYSILLPAGTDGPCIALLTVHAITLERLGDGASAEAALQPYSRARQRPVGLGGCAWYAAFGAPGAAVAQWLAWTSFAYAGSGPGEDASDGERVLVLDDEQRYLAGIRAHGAACSAGNLAACRWVLMGEQRNSYLFRMFQRGPGDMIRVEPVSEGFGQAQHRLLADMLADIGPSAFQRFWSSDLPLEEAFVQATGRDLIAWTQQWARRTIGPVEAGPMPTVATAGMAALLVVAGLGIGVARRRRA